MGEHALWRQRWSLGRGRGYCKQVSVMTGSGWLSRVSVADLLLRVGAELQDDLGLGVRGEDHALGAWAW